MENSMAEVYNIPSAGTTIPYVVTKLMLVVWAIFSYKVCVLGMPDFEIS